MLNDLVPGVLPRCRVLHNALSPAELAEAPVDLPARSERLRVLMLGNILPFKKGYDTVIELGKAIRQQHLPIEIEIGGRQDGKHWLENRISGEGLESTIRYSGPVPEPYPFLRTGNVFLLMSRFEGTPNALLEAMNVGLPSISTKVGDVTRWSEDGIHIRHIEIDDVNGALQALLELLHNWPQARLMGAAGQKLCRHLFNPERLSHELGLLLRDFHTAESDSFAEVRTTI
jgi:glycosyltransferase involved in cell wall biosynthesis